MYNQNVSIGEVLSTESEVLCFEHGQDEKGEQKHITRTFAGFHNHSPLLPMPRKYKSPVEGYFMVYYSKVLRN